MAEKKMGFDAPEVFEEAFKKFLEKEIVRILRDEGWRPSEEDPNVWVRPSQDIDE